MELQNNELINKYWNANTSPDEEKHLKSQANNIVPEGADKEYFSFLNEQGSVKPLKKFKSPAGKERFNFRLLVAAITIVILISTVMMNFLKTDNRYELTDPQEAYKVTYEAFMKVSGGLNKGALYADNISKFNEAQERVKSE